MIYGPYEGKGLDNNGETIFTEVSFSEGFKQQTIIDEGKIDFEAEAGIITDSLGFKIVEDIDMLRKGITHKTEDGKEVPLQALVTELDAFIDEEHQGTESTNFLIVVRHEQLAVGMHLAKIDMIKPHELQMFMNSMHVQ